MGGLRICMLTTFYTPYHFGGDGVTVQRLSQGLVRRGHEVSVVHDVDAYLLSHSEPLAERAAEPEGLEVIALRGGAGPLGPLLVQQLGRPVLNRARIRQLLEAGRYDVVNFHNVSLVGGPGLLAEGTAHKLYTAHEYWLVCPTHGLWRHGREACPGRECLRCVLRHRRPPQLWRHTGHLKRYLAHVDAFISPSEAGRAKHHEFGFPYEMEVLPGLIADGEALDERGERSQPVHPRPYFLFAGRLERMKGLDDVIPLFRRYREADLLIAGDGTHANVLRALAHGLPGVTFLGSLAFEELRRYYAQAIAVIVPSRCFETFCLVVVEAFREGTPVIARRVGALPELVEQANAGILFGEPAELLAAMERLRTDTDLRTRMARAGRDAYLERWSEPAVVSGYLDIVRRVAERKGDARIAAMLRAEPQEVPRAD
jgi:glycosyltransferase involved in cell wall biosynthesis